MRQRNIVEAGRGREDHLRLADQLNSLHVYLRLLQVKVVLIRDIVAEVY